VMGSSDGSGSEGAPKRASSSTLRLPPSARRAVVVDLRRHEVQRADWGYEAWREERHRAFTR
jgi:hypothetical protein